MRFTVPRKPFYEALTTACRAVSARSTLPILANVAITLSDGTVRLAATDLELGIEATCQATTAADGPAVTVPAKKVQEIVGALPGEVLSFAAADGRVVLSAEKAEYVLLTLPAEEFPPLPEVGDRVFLLLPAQVLARLLKRTVFAASTDDTRPTLTGVFLTVRGGEITAAATDTHRLAVAKTMGCGGTGEGTALLPARACEEVLRALSGLSEEGVRVQWDENQALFSIGGTVLITRLLAGPFIKYERVIPASFDVRWEAVTGDLYRLCTKSASRSA